MLPPISRRDSVEERRVRLRLPGPGRAGRRAGGGRSPANPLAPRPPHFAPRAKRVIFLFMQGGVSQVDSFDYKPRPGKDDGKMLAFDDARVHRQHRARGARRSG